MDWACPFPAPSLKRTVDAFDRQWIGIRRRSFSFTLPANSTAGRTPGSRLSTDRDKRASAWSKSGKLGCEYMFSGVPPANDIRSAVGVSAQGQPVTDSATEDLSSEAERRAKRACLPKPEAEKPARPRVPIRPNSRHRAAGPGRRRQGAVEGPPAHRRCVLPSAALARERLSPRQNEAATSSRAVDRERAGDEQAGKSMRPVAGLAAKPARPASRSSSPDSSRRRYPRSSPRGGPRLSAVGDEGNRRSLRCSRSGRPRAGTSRNRSTRGRHLARARERAFVGKPRLCGQDRSHEIQNGPSQRSRRSITDGNWKCSGEGTTIPLRDHGCNS